MLSVCIVHLVLLYRYGAVNFACVCVHVDSTKEGYKTYARWKRTWSSNAAVEANVKLFLCDRYMPFWVQCTNCSQWRQLPKDTSFSPELIRNYKCDANMEVLALL